MLTIKCDKTDRTVLAWQEPVSADELYWVVVDEVYDVGAQAQTLEDAIARFMIAIELEEAEVVKRNSDLPTRPKTRSTAEVPPVWAR